jgi:CheY-like chemotaxis protein
MSYFKRFFDMDSKYKRFLIVDDEPIIRMTYGDFVKDLIPEAEVYEAENAAQAICMYFEKRPDIVLLDIMMPVMSGEIFLDVLEEGISKEILSSKPRIIVVTSVSDSRQLLELTRRFAVEAVVSKPLLQPQLAEILEIKK